MTKVKLEIIFEVAQDPEGGYIAEALGEAIFTEADTLEELRENLREAVICHYDDEEARPKLIRMHFVHDEVLAV